jgi:hypothetical protein
MEGNKPTLAPRRPRGGLVRRPPPYQLRRACRRRSSFPSKRCTASTSFPRLVLISSFGCCQVFRSGCCFTRGKGRIIYSSPGDESYRAYHQLDRILANAVRWTNQREVSGALASTIRLAGLGSGPAA